VERRVFNIFEIIECAFDLTRPAPDPRIILGKVVEFSGIGRSWKFSFPEDEVAFKVLKDLPGHTWPDCLRCIEGWARVYWRHGQEIDELHLLACHGSSIDAPTFSDVVLLLPAGQEAAYKRQISFAGGTAMNFDGCAEFLLTLRRTWNRKTDNALRRISPICKLRPRACWIGPNIPGLDDELQAIADVYGFQIRPAWTSQGRKNLDEQFRRLGTEAPINAVFSWDIRSQNLAAVAQEKFSHVVLHESCNDWETSDMLTMLRIWLAQNFATLADVGGFVEGEVTLERLRSVIGDGRVLCVHMDGRTGLKEALKRAGFCEDGIERYFEEIPVDPGRNSNLMETLGDKPERYTHLLYAWEGLRHTSSEVEQRFGGNLFKASTSFRVVSLFKAKILKLK
jgi:hypothetical protein